MTPTDYTLDEHELRAAYGSRRWLLELQIYTAPDDFIFNCIQKQMDKLDDARKSDAHGDPLPAFRSMYDIGHYLAERLEPSLVKIHGESYDIVETAMDLHDSRLEEERWVVCDLGEHASLRIESDFETRETIVRDNHDGYGGTIYIIVRFDDMRLLADCLSQLREALPRYRATYETMAREDAKRLKAHQLRMTTLEQVAKERAAQTGIPEFDVEMETHGAKLSFRLPDRIEVSFKLSKNNIAGDTEAACADARALYDVLKAKKSKRVSIKVRK